ncbi:Carcinoembryonic antigen-related cell adhesion molecule 5 [Cricetulus griseus]|uniref:Carcinoembryonic antigen-related cell adhesion molecule 5 n=1 Tax=Cricetulus griseus TaxID=10029 RepID=G3IFX9_CRIGR|nr:Carcinoembryonic antigen-related cell adhesion molecule 5 [Cricetulus griseus]
MGNTIYGPAPSKGLEIFWKVMNMEKNTCRRRPLLDHDFGRASFLTFCHLSTTAHVTVTTESVPPLVAKGDDVLFLVHELPENIEAIAWFKGLTNMKDAIAVYGLFNNISSGTVGAMPPLPSPLVTLLIHNIPENLQGFVWFKGISVFWKNEIARYTIDSKSSITGPAHTGRETLNGDGSLVLHGVTQNDTGLYTLRIMGTDMKSEEAHVQLQVDIMIQSVPLYAAEGESVLLQVHNLPEDFKAFTWYRAIYRVPHFEIVEHSRELDTITWGDQYSRRETVYDNGTLLLQNITEQDAGMYTLAILKSEYKIENVYVKVHVNKHVAQPFVRVTNSVVSSHRSAILNCVSPDTDVSIRWFFNNRPLRLSRRMTLSPTKCGLRIYPVKLENIGEYKCEVSNRVSSKTSLPVWFQ